MLGVVAHVVHARFVHHHECICVFKEGECATSQRRLLRFKGQNYTMQQSSRSRCSAVHATRALAYCVETINWLRVQAQNCKFVVDRRDDH